MGVCGDIPRFGRALLRQKGFHVFTVNPHVTVYEALEKMADRDIGALVVMDGFDFAWLFSERDYVRKVILSGKCPA